MVYAIFFRDNIGEYSDNFFAFLVEYNILYAEIMGVIIGMEHSWEIGSIVVFAYRGLILLTMDENGYGSYMFA